MRSIVCWLVGVACLIVAPVKAQERFTDYQLEIVKTTEKIEIDGYLDEVIWSKLDRASGFTQNFPNEFAPASSKSEVVMTYDDQFLYVAAVMYDDLPGDYVVSSLRRDFDFDDNDAFVIYLDPYNDGTNGFSFAVSPFNVQREALINNGNREATDWDNRWFSQVKRYDDRWTVEMAIPFKTLRFNEGKDLWRVNFARNDRKRFEVSSWIPVPINFDVSSLAFTGYLNWDEPLKKPGANVALIPFVAGGLQKDFEEGTATQTTSSAGFDAKVAVTPALNLDLTFNPDFSQVEVDRQQTNLNRFELFFPERRQFFLENADLFSDFGFSRIRPFFSRRIGIATDSIGRTSQNRIQYGARLSGKLDDNWRIGLLNMQTAEDNGIGFPAQNFTVATVQRKVFARSNIAAIFVNRETTSSADQTNVAAYNRVVGLDYNLASADNRWNGKFFYHQSFSPGNPTDSYAHASYLGYNVKGLRIMWNHEYVGENYNAEVGFVPRQSYWRLEPSINYRFFPENSPILRHGPRVYLDLYANKSLEKTDETIEFSYQIDWKNTSSLNIFTSNEYLVLTFPFDPTRTGGEQLLAGASYSYFRYGVQYNSDLRKLFNWSGSVAHGKYFNGDRFEMSGELNYRYQPYGSVSVAFNYNEISLPQPYNSATLFLVGPRFDISFTDQLFISTFVQYNNQIDNINLNTRLQWRFRPVSDLFLVYTDNYFPENLKVKNRALILKLSYWINV